MSDTTAPTPTLYEILLIMAPDILDFDAAVENLKEILTSHGASIVNEDNAGLRDLAYTIRKHQKGYYLILNLNFDDPSKISELENALNIEQSLLRYMIMKMPTAYQTKTLAEYDLELEQVMKQKTAKKEERTRKSSRSRVERPSKAKKEESKKEEPKAKKVEKESPKEEKKKEEKVVEKEKVVKETKEVEEKVAEKEEEKAPKKEAKKAEKLTDKQSEEKLKELDEKLKSIIDDPDISL